MTIDRSLAAPTGTWAAAYRQKVKSADDVAATVQSGDFVYVNGGPGYPCDFMEALARRAPQLEGVRFGHPMRRASRQLDPDPYSLALKGHLQHVSDFSFDTDIRAAINSGLATFRPNIPTETARFFAYPLDVVVCAASPMDAHGYFSLGAFGGWGIDFVRRAKRIVLEVNPNQPRILGDCWVHVSQVDALIESDYPLAAQSPSSQEGGGASGSDVERRIAENVMELIEEGSTLQFGGGTMPNLVAEMLLKSGKRHLNLHSEAVSDWLPDLIESGVVDNLGKTRHRGKTVFAVALGSPRLYEFIHDNPGCEVHSIAYINEPCFNQENPKQVSINASLAIDLWGQCCSETLGTTHYSGTGGQWEFNRSGYLSPGGCGIIALPSMAKGGKVSRISSTLPPGSAVSITRNDVDHVVTEWGIARLKGKDTADRARELIAITHPDFREELRQEAVRRNLI